MIESRRPARLAGGATKLTPVHIRHCRIKRLQRSRHVRQALKLTREVGNSGSPGEEAILNFERPTPNIQPPSCWRKRARHLEIGRWAFEVQKPLQFREFHLNLQEHCRIRISIERCLTLCELEQGVDGLFDVWRLEAAFTLQAEVETPNGDSQQIAALGGDRGVFGIRLAELSACSDERPQ